MFDCELMSLAVRHHHSTTLPQAGKGTTIAAIAVTPNNKYLLTGSSTGNLLVWELASGALLRDVLVRSGGRISLPCMCSPPRQVVSLHIYHMAS